MVTSAPPIILARVDDGGAVLITFGRQSTFTTEYKVRKNVTEMVIKAFLAILSGQRMHVCLAQTLLMFSGASPRTSLLHCRNMNTPPMSVGNKRNAIRIAPRRAHFFNERFMERHHLGIPPSSRHGVEMTQQELKAFAASPRGLSLAQQAVERKLNT